jgi:hypothetical protein
VRHGHPKDPPQPDHVRERQLAELRTLTAACTHVRLP